jgi:hypothetical protein
MPDAPQCIVYKENTESVRLDLSQFRSAQSAVAVDTTRPYKEIGLGRLKPEVHNWKAPRRSDWAIAVGEFEGRK